MYTENKCAVRIGSRKTVCSSCRGGVRQGLLSPALFSIFINELVVLLEQSAAPGFTV
uniref:Uncharacterized protein n=1 Tax=Anguilla anguilla TaxID=7936 RepID=A0A0E9QS55_ANGAN